jgi:phosphoserine phosphatase RsbU/P
MIPAALWPRLFPALLVLVPLLAVSRVRAIPSLGFVAVAAAIMLLRDAAYTFLGQVLLYPVSELVLMSVYVAWLRSFTGWRRLDGALLGVNGLAAVLAVADIFLGFLPQSEFFLGLLLLTNVAYFAVNAGLLSGRDAEGPETVLRSRFAMTAALFIIHLVSLLYGWDHPLVQGILVPGSYLVPAFLVVVTNTVLHRDSARSVQFYSTNLDATYGFMENLGNAITSKIDIPRVLEIIITAAVRNIGADAGAILTVDEYEDILRVRAVYGIHPPLGPVPQLARVTPAALKRHFAETPIPVGQTILGQTVAEGKAVHVRDAALDPRLSHNAKDDILYVSSLAAIPLVVRDRVLGVLSVLKRVEGGRLEERDVQHLTTLAEYASITIDNIYTYMEVLEKREIEREVDIAAQIQQKLLPARLPDTESAAIAVYNKPAKGVSGDYYDVFRLGDGKLGVAICDVAGKGIPAALVMVMIRSVLHLVISPERDAAATLAWINRGITGRIDLDHFATVSILIFDEKSREIQYANAAHLPMLVHKQGTGTTFKVDTEGLPIGIEKDARYEQKRFLLEKGDVVLLCTDGIIEAMNPAGQQYGVAGLRRILEKCASLPPAGLVGAIREDLGRFVGTARQHDDQTLLVMKA